MAGISRELEDSYKSNERLWLGGKGIFRFSERIVSFAKFSFIIDHLSSNYRSYFNLFLANVPILCPLKTPENQMFLVFSGVIKWEHWPEMG